jgi:hypothetical protein
MANALLQQLRSKVEAASGPPATTRTEILKLVTELERETATSGSTVHRRGLDQLVATVEGLEASHPEITALANRIATGLANVGI